MNSTAENLNTVFEQPETEGTILVVDDHAAARETLEEFLSDGGFRIISTSSGRKAIEIASSTEIDVVLLDIGLPDLSGLEVCEILRQSDATRNVPVLFLSGHIDTETIVKGFEVGGTDYIRKPYYHAEVLARVRANVELSRMRANMESIKEHLEHKVSKRSRQLQNEAKRHQHTADILHEFIVYDRVTGLDSRESLISRLEMYVAKVSPDARNDCAVIHLDSVGFANVNLSLGFEVGDEVLVEIANRLRKLRRKIDIASRPNSDEFVLVVFGRVSKEAALELTTEINTVLSKPYVVADHEVRLNFNMGITLSTSRQTTARTLLNEADNALRRSKVNPLTWRTFYRGEMHQNAKNRLTLETEVRRAIDLHELVFHYQPIVDLKTNAISSVEALVRWNHPQEGMIAPNRFLHIIEELGLSPLLDEYVIDEAVKQIRWLDTSESTAGLSVNINLFAQELEYRSIVDRLASTVERFKVDPARLQLEVTEGAFISDMHKASRIVGALQEIGFIVVMDDFGSGYSSLNQIRNISFDSIKLDQVFIQQLSNKGYSNSIQFIRKVVELCHSLTDTVIAEGVETEYQSTIVKSLDCSHGQGLLYGSPMSQDKLAIFCGGYGSDLTAASTPVHAVRMEVPGQAP